ncbi:MAG: ferrous iron transport protein B [Desulfobacteraceae bacterium]|nr:ferrous iron transport protein B [Desulfobacteraceae bacterium]
MPTRNLTIALAGNPNSGKTTIFNILTGTRQKVGNWPGVTVEKKEGTIHRFDRRLKIIDLPGTYSLTPFSIEEIVARDYILLEKPDVVIDIIDASNLERSLYLATQLRELDCKVLFALNMADMARSRGINIDGGKLSELLDVPVMFTVGNKSQGIDALLKAAVELADKEKNSNSTRKVRYNKDIEHSIGVISESIGRHFGETLSFNTRWTAVKLIENDSVVREHLLAMDTRAAEAVLTEVQAQRTTLTNLYDEDPEILATDERYGFITGLIKEVFTISPGKRVDISRNVDLVLTNRFLGMPIFFFFIWAMFQTTFTFGGYPMAWIETLVGLLSTALSNTLPESLLKSLLVDGIIGGVGSVVVFLPNILMLFFCIALFEDTGYMARAAFLMDKVMHLIGLHGKSFIPMLMGFGCNVPAVMAARTLESKKDRILTILITPFMSCSAKLPVYIVLAGTFFGPRAGTVIFCIYLTGILLSIGTGRLFRKTLFRGEEAPFVMELPPYRVPMAKSLLIHMWDRSKIFLRKMGGIILAGSIVIWVLSAFPRAVVYDHDYAMDRTRIHQLYAEKAAIASPSEMGILAEQRGAALGKVDRAENTERIEKSYMGKIGKFIAPVFKPIGVEWQGGVALLSGFVAKEIVVSTLGVLYAAGEEDGDDALPDALRRSGMTPLSALSMMVFVLLYLPCLATVSAIRRETGSFRWMLFSIGFNTGVAWFFSLLVYQGGKLFGIA